MRLTKTIENATVNVSRKVTKAKLKKDKTLDVSFEETVTIIEIIDGEEVSKTVQAEYTRIGKNIVHEDMEAALEYLRPHLAILCDQVEAQDKEYYELDSDLESLDRYKVNSYAIGGSGISEGVTLTGTRYGKYGPQNLNSQFTKYEGGENEETYEHAFELRGMINHCNEEALLYVEGKMAPTAQLDMFEQEEKERSENEGQEFE